MHTSMGQEQLEGGRASSCKPSTNTKALQQISRPMKSPKARFGRESGKNPFGCPASCYEGCWQVWVLEQLKQKESILNELPRAPVEACPGRETWCIRKKPLWHAVSFGGDERALVC